MTDRLANESAPDGEAPAVQASDAARYEEYALTASLLPHVLALRVSWPRDPENPAPGVVGSLVKDGRLWRVKGVPSPSMPLRNAVLSLLMGHRPRLAGLQAMALADRAVSAYLTSNPGLDYGETHIIDGYTVELTRPGGTRYYRLIVSGSHDAYFKDLGTARDAMSDEVRSVKGADMNTVTRPNQQTPASGTADTDHDPTALRRGNLRAVAEFNSVASQAALGVTETAGRASTHDLPGLPPEPIKASFPGQQASRSAVPASPDADRRRPSAPDGTSGRRRSR